MSHIEGKLEGGIYKDILPRHTLGLLFVVTSHGGSLFLGVYHYPQVVVWWGWKRITPLCDVRDQLWLQSLAIQTQEELKSSLRPVLTCLRFIEHLLLSSKSSCRLSFYQILCKYYWS